MLGLFKIDLTKAKSITILNKSTHKPSSNYSVLAPHRALTPLPIPPPPPLPPLLLLCLFFPGQIPAPRLC